MRFTYRAASTGEVREREVEPWRLAARRGGWYVLGRDRDRRAPRAFRLSRIEGNVRASGAAGSFEPPAEVDVDAFLSGRGGQERVALLAVVPERAGAVRARAVRPDRASDDSPQDPVADGRDVLHVPFTSLGGFASELAGYADAVVVLDPRDLREAVVARLRTAAGLDAASESEQHGGAGVDRG
ncbi:hypothetical protein GCM10025864_37550 [Luteimicrobium album]|uniref:WYL domain-containing protein n=1 Tax=Luteimicrobium album TaxID=1054550 RepID=A0ABQ6I6S5_9MICO|nr:WYL domain-containing protein [Luteimicrobium album]GMA25996.1 hypothetical protein GCM10025864_37550 [Luteimicrobium album]